MGEIHVTISINNGIIEIILDPPGGDARTSIENLRLPEPIRAYKSLER